MKLNELEDYVANLDYLTSCLPTIVVEDVEGLTDLQYEVTQTEEIYDFPSDRERKEYIDKVVCMPNFVSLKKKDIEEKLDKNGEVKVPESYRLNVKFNHN